MSLCLSAAAGHLGVGAADVCPAICSCFLAHPARPRLRSGILRLRGGGVLQFAATQARVMMEERVRQDDHRSAISALRCLMGVWLLFQPLRHAGLVDRPLGRSVLQLFFAAHFYFRLCGLLVARVDVFAVPRSNNGRLRKFAMRAALLALASTASRHLGWEAGATTLRRALPGGLALGVVIARSATAVFDHFSSELHESLRYLAAKRAIFTPEHASVFVDLDEALSSAWGSEEERALNEAAERAREAVKKALSSGSRAQEAARRASAQRIGKQVARTAIAVTGTAAGLAVACERRLPLADRLPSPPSPEALALFAPALVGAFELTSALREVRYLNAFRMRTATVQLVTLAPRLLRRPLGWLFALCRLLFGGARSAFGSAIRLEARLERSLLGQEYVLYREVMRFARSPAGRRIGRWASALRELAGWLAWAIRGATLAKAPVRWARGFLRGTHNEVWPWALAVAGYRVQTGALPLHRVPGCVGRLSAAPVVACSKAVTAAWLAARRSLPWPAG